MLRFYRLVKFFDPVFQRQAEGLPIRAEDVARMEYYKPDQNLPTPKQQRVLETRLKVKADLVSGTYPFSNMKLSRPDVRWLLMESKGAVDLRGTDLSKTDLRELDLRRRC